MPAKWQEVPLSEVAAAFDGSMVDGPFGSNLKSSEYTDEGVRLIQLQNLGDGYWKNDNAAYISYDKFASLSRHGASPGDIAIAKMADPIARACIIPDIEKQYVVVADCIKLTVNQARFDPSFIVKAVNFHRFREQAERVGIGTTRKRVNLSQVRRLTIQLPPLPEQRRIAEILDTLDRTIEGTQRIIEKLQATRQGLLHDLLTRGLDEQGQLRDPEKNPELFHDTALGRLPKAWEVLRLRDGLSTKISNGVFKRPSDVGSGVPLVNVSDLYQDFEIDLRLVESFSASRQEQTNYDVKDGDIFFTRSSLNLQGIAHCNIVRQSSPGAVFECHVMRARPDQKKFVPDFLALWCRTKAAKAHFMGSAKHTTMTTISQPDIESLPTPCPPLQEQQQVVSFVDGSEFRIKSELSKLTKLQALKRGLMEDLLTGRVRVPLPAADVKDSDATDAVRPAPRIVVPNDLPAILPMPDVVAQPAIRPLYRAAAGADTQAMTEWTRQLAQAVQGQQVGAYSTEALDAVLPELMGLTADRNGLLRVPEVLAKAGIRFMLLPHIAGSRSSGAAFYLDEPGRTQPVVGLSLRYPYLDVFWFNLLHELAHIRLGHTPVPDETLDEYDQNSPDEQAANKWAQDMLVPPQQWQWFLDLRPFKTQQMHGFARRIKRHISIVAGRYGHETGNWARMNELTLRHSVKDELTKLQKRLTGEVNP